MPILRDYSHYTLRNINLKELMYNISYFYLTIVLKNIHSKVDGATYRPYKSGLQIKNTFPQYVKVQDFTFLDSHFTLLNIFQVFPD